MLFLFLDILKKSYMNKYFYFGEKKKLDLLNLVGNDF